MRVDWTLLVLAHRCRPRSHLVEAGSQHAVWVVVALHLAQEGHESLHHTRFQSGKQDNLRSAGSELRREEGLWEMSRQVMPGDRRQGP